MRLQLLFLLVFSTSFFSQNNISVEFIEKIKKNDKTILFNIDYFGNKYYLNENEFFKNKKNSFSNFSLGSISKVDIHDPMKIKLWYKYYGTVVILDNYLNEITSVNFNNINLPHNISHISTANNNYIWVFDELNMKIKKFDFIKKIFLSDIEFQLNESVLDLESNFNFLWILTENFFYKLNYNGSVIFKLKNNKYKKISLLDRHIILSNNSDIVFFNEDKMNFKNLSIEKLFIKDFFVINESLYIYDKDHLYKYLTLIY